MSLKKTFGTLDNERTKYEAEVRISAFDREFSLTRSAQQPRSVRMKCIGLVVMSLDGRITRHHQEGIEFASAVDQQFFHAALQDFDSCIFGAHTFRISQSAILAHRSKCRLRVVMTRHPEEYAAFYQSDTLEFTNLTPPEIVADLQGRNNQRCAILGGAEIYTLFFQHALLHELWVTVEPQIFGAGKPLLTQPIDIQLSLNHVIHLSKDTLLLKYAVCQPTFTGT